MIAKAIALEETYHDVKNLILKMSWNAYRTFGGDVEDYVSAGNVAFMEAYATFDDDKDTEFSTWVWWKIKGAISHEVRSTKKRRARFEEANLAEMALPELSHFDVDVFMEDLNNDAQTVVRLLLDTPYELDWLLKCRDVGDVVRSGLVCRLKGLGWTVARVMESFVEIKEAL